MISIRDGLNKMCSITRDLGEEPQQDALESALSRRETVIANEIEKNSKDLAAAFPDWRLRVKNDDDLRKILSEIEGLMHSLARMDQALAQTMQRRMSGVKARLSSMYHSSRAACSYTIQSKLS
jgi:hypothetical protein